jgi:hypothetical protein
MGGETVLRHAGLQGRVAHRDIARTLGPAGARERAARRERVGLEERLAQFGLLPHQRVQRQAQAHRRVARQQEHIAAAEGPGRTGPAAGVVVPAERQGITDDLVETALEQAPQAGPLETVFEPAVEHVDVLWQRALLPEVVEHVLETGLDVVRAHTQAGGETAREGAGDLVVGLAARAGIGEQRSVLPYRGAVASPQARQRPARQRLAGVPLALAVMQHPAGGEALPAGGGSAHRRARACAGPSGGGVPLGAVHSRRWTRRSARRPWSGARRPWPAARRRRACPAPSIRCQAASRRAW